MTVPQTAAESDTAASLAQSRRDHVPRGVSTAHPIWIASGDGAVLWDVDGRRYVDFAGGIGTMNVGHGHPAVVAAIVEQAARLTHTCFQVAAYEPYVRVAEELNRRAPGTSKKKTLLLSTGAEATENSIKIARQYTRRSAVIAFDGSFHGRTMLALSMTGKDAPYKQHFGPFCSDVYHAPFPNERAGVSTSAALAALDELFRATVAPDRVCAIIVEPVLGEGGFVPAPPDFLRELRRLTSEQGIVFIVDEIQTGFGRTGRLFACEHFDIEPDLIAVAKSLGGGLPLSAVIGKSEIMDAPEPGGLGGTFAGNPVACAAALAVLEIIGDAFLARAREIGERIASALTELQSEFAQVVDVRGLGAMMAMELSSGAPAVMEAARRRGLLLLLAGAGNVIRVLVPLIASDAELEEGLQTLRASMREALNGSATR
jgi:4-aminobutyrate aminotransferase / (S)-3-amino-2-methylpropionate transaminase / 5-aminovalerate transaminase